MNVGIGSREQSATGQLPAPGPEDSPETHTQRPSNRSGLAGLLDLGRDMARRGVRAGRSTPGQLSVLAVAIVVVATVLAVVGTVLVVQRGDTTDRLTTNREPLAVAAQELYSALSDADVTAARSFLVAEGQQKSVWNRYEKDIDNAGSALAEASSDAGTVSDAFTQVEELNKRLPVYTALIEQARSDSDTDADPAADGAVGGQSLHEAAKLMRSHLLPAAKQLYRINKTQLTDEQDSAAAFPWALVTLVALLLIVLVATQVYLRRRTRRLFNVGLLVGTGAVIVMVLWGGTAITLQSVFVNSGSGTTAQENTLVHARITALRARADEMFMLLADDDDLYRKEFTKLSEKLVGPGGDGGALHGAENESSHESTDEHIDFAQDSASSWLGIHDTIRTLLTGASKEKAIELATNTHGGSSTATFTHLDQHLTKAIDSARGHFRDDITTASNSLTMLAPGIVLLSVIAAVGATIGLRERIREYG